MTVSVGDPRIKWACLGPQADMKQVVLLEGGTERVVGITAENIELVEVDGLPALRRTQAAESEYLGDRISTSVVLRSTFQPVSHRDEYAGVSVSVGYTGLEISGSRRRKDGTAEPIRLTLDRPVFDYHSVEMILRVLPLERGYTARLPAYHAGLGQVLWVTLRVSGEEETDAGGGRMAKAWIVETDWGHAKVEYWIGQESPELLKQSSVLSSGAVLQFVR